MIVVMRKSCTKEEIDGVRKRIREHGLDDHLSRGVERTVVGVVGQTFPELKDELQQLPGVLEVVPISKPYKRSSREFQPVDTVVTVGDATIGGKDLVVMAGPCAVESEEQLYSFRGLGIHALRLLATAREETGLVVITEVMAPEDVDLVAQYADILQVGTRNMQNFRLLDEVGKSRKPVMLKRGFSSTYEEWLLAAEYVLAAGNEQLMLCERGIRTFEQYTRNTLDITAIPVIRNLSHLPIIADPSHATGRWDLVTPMALAAVAAGVNGLIVEVHPNPGKALSDGSQSLTLENFRRFMERVRALFEVVSAE